jgi:hypothetical protein
MAAALMVEMGGYDGGSVEHNHTFSFSQQGQSPCGNRFIWRVSLSADESGGDEVE